MEQKNAVKNLYRDVVEKIYEKESSKITYIHCLLETWKWKKKLLNENKNQCEK